MKTPRKPLFDIPSLTKFPEQICKSDAIFFHQVNRCGKFAKRKPLSA